MPHCKNCGRDFALGKVCPSCGAYCFDDTTNVENSGCELKENEKGYSSNRAYNAMFVMYCLVALIAITTYVVCAVTAVYFIRLHSASIIWTIVSIAMIGASAILGLKVGFELIAFYCYGFTEKDFLRVSSPSKLMKWMRKNVLPFVKLVVLFVSIMPIITTFVGSSGTVSHNSNLMIKYFAIIVGANIGYYVLEGILIILYNCLAKDFLKSVYVGETAFRSYRVKVKADKLYNYSNFQSEINFLAVTRKKVVRLLSAISSLALIVIIFISSINTLSFAQISTGDAIKLGMVKSDVINLMGEPRSFASYDEMDEEEMNRRDKLSNFTYYSGRVDFLRKKAIKYSCEIEDYKDSYASQNAYSSDRYKNLSKKYNKVNIKAAERDYSTLSVKFNDIGQVISVRYDKQANKNIYPLERKKVKNMELSHKLTAEGALSQEALNKFLDWNKVWVSFEFTDGSYAYYYLDRVSYNDSTGEVYFNDEWAKKCVLIKGVESDEK